MVKHVGFLGCGKIGKAILKHLLELPDVKISFVQDLSIQNTAEYKFPVIKEKDSQLLAATDLVVECATADVLKENAENILKNSDLMPFSLTAFSDADFESYIKKIAKKYNHKIFVPHGAILGLDGIFDGRNVLESVSITTTKNPDSLGRSDTERTIVYDGTAREACKLYPRNVNVHAALALAGIGFDKTHSVIISDPSVSNNMHRIIAEGEGISFEIVVNSFSTGGVTGKYTPYSACGSLDRWLSNKNSIFSFV